MNEKPTGGTSANHKTDWGKLRSVAEEDIRAGIEADPDAHPTDEEFWKDAKVVMPKAKQGITIRLDADLLEWLRQGKGYQTRINAILRAYMRTQKETSP